MLYLGCSCLNLSLGIFLEFLWFSEYFSCLKIIYRIFLDYFRTGNIFWKKKKKNPTYRIGPSPRLDPTRAAAAAHAGPIWARKAPPPGKAAAPVARPHKGRRPCSARLLPLLRAALVPPPPAPASAPPPLAHSSAAAQHRSSSRRRRNQTATVDRKIRPVPSSSARGEHTIAILSISSLRFASSPNP
jgi:hypothetical protein